VIRNEVFAFIEVQNYFKWCKNDNQIRIKRTISIKLKYNFSNIDHYKNNNNNIIINRCQTKPISIKEKLCKYFIKFEIQFLQTLEHFS